jgi:hypothetical protein
MHKDRKNWKIFFRSFLWPVETRKANGLGLGAYRIPFADPVRLDIVLDIQ